MTPPHVKRLHWGFADPARVTGPEETVLAAFRTVRDGIRERVEPFLRDELRRTDEHHEA